ncbi:4Fe-4S binding protein [Desulfosoma caldarium]|uniref:4Fe-4S dicluster protein n=1 Tax=Desulfosoma caldarium TaxID=610254 RepID=A0A3N1UNY6_9BACT|nr:4Fe-4S binding protein [Desulfosoma caldarium]ROQ90207.1 4Fe-4S dicluster protein [Desulfosoma caldarium]
MRETIRQWLEDGLVDLFVGYKAVDGLAIPWVFSKKALDDLDDFREGPYRYPLEKIAREILQEDPHLRIGILARQCTERATTVLHALRAIDQERIELLRTPCCASPMQTQVICSGLDRGEDLSRVPGEGIPKGKSFSVVDSMSAEERFSRWMYEFEKCIKCYGCRDICPVCVCRECTLQDEDLIKTGSLPVEVPLFHLVRAVHMAGRCVDCGLCEEACPADIPLRTLYQKVGVLVRDLYGYVPGQDAIPLIWGPLSDAEREALASGT